MDLINWLQTDFLGLRTYFSGELYREAFEYIRDTYPYWNQTEGRDHMWVRFALG